MKTMKSLLSPIVRPGARLLHDGAFLCNKIIGLVAPEGVVMLDFDLPTGGHEHSPVGCVTVQTREEAWKRMEAYVRAFPDTSFYVQNTAGGVRAFIAQETAFAAGLRISADLNADPAYRTIAEKQGYMTIRIGNKWEENQARQRTGRVRPEVWERPVLLGSAKPDSYLEQWMSYYWSMCQKYDGIASWMTQEEHDELMAEARQGGKKAAPKNESGLTSGQTAVIDRKLRKWIANNPRAGKEQQAKMLATLIRKAKG